MRVLTRHSRNGQWLGGTAGAALGAVIGNGVDNRAQQRQEAQYQAEQQAQTERQAQEQDMAQEQARREAQGAQVIVRMNGGNTVAVFVHNAARFHRGQKVWMIGESQIIPAG